MCLTDGRPIGTAGLHVKEYQPLVAFPGLFRVFADTEPTQDGIKTFADRFGPLGRDRRKSDFCSTTSAMPKVSRLAQANPWPHGTVRFW